MPRLDRPTADGIIEEALDTVLEASILGSFTRIGPAVRSRTDDWEPVDTDLTGQTVVLTGGSSGLGRETARRLVDLGATVHLTSRDRDRADEVADDINRRDPAGQAEGAQLDTADFDSIVALADRLADVGSVGPSGRVDVLIHNAGALTDDYRKAPLGTELTLASHLVGPYALTRLLRPRLSSGARVLWMSSGGMYTQGLDVSKLEMSADEYRGAVAYARAKRAQVELVAHLAPSWSPEVVMHAMHPGWVDTDGVAQGLPGFGKIMGPLLRDVEAGADTMVWLAAGGADQMDDRVEPGRFWLDRRPRSTVYLPGTATTAVERQRLVDWLEARIEPVTTGRAIEHPTGS